MAKILETKTSIVFENNYTEIEISNKNASVEKIIDKKTGKDFKGEDTFFFSLVNKDKEAIAINALSLKGDILTIDSANGKFDLEVKAFDNYFTFELITKLPEGVYTFYLAEAKYSYDPGDKKNTGAVGIAMTIKVDPVYYPDAKSCHTQGRVFPHLADKGAKYGLVIAPIIDQRNIIKELSLTIDRNEGIVSSTGGAWSRDSRLNFSDYGIIVETKKEFIDSNLEYFKSMGIDQIDIHKGGGSFRQGDFKIMRYENIEEFKKNVVDVFKANGMAAGLHTYSHYVNYDCDTILSKPENLAQIKIMETFTLADDMDAECMFVNTVESTECVSSDHGFCRTNSPFVLIDDELIEFINHPHGFTVKSRGCAGTKAVPHKKGAAVKHLEGHYAGLCPVFGSDLFLQVARNTAKTYNDGGFEMIYLDALDGIAHHCSRQDEYWYYVALFVHEVLKNCKTDPILEGATYTESMWAARGRIGAWDIPYRGYKNWNAKHARSNKSFVDRYNAPTMGWYEMFPKTEMYPGNEHTKYQHTDCIEHYGALLLMHDFSTVVDTLNKDFLERYATQRRNTALFKIYDDLRKAQYFSEEYRQKLIDSPFEVHLKKKRGNNWVFEQKDYQSRRVFDLENPDMNKVEFKNPFGAQLPFVRIEASLSSAHENGMMLLPLDENKELTSQKLKATYGGEINIANNLSKTVRVFGNGIKGGKICIKVDCATNSEQGIGIYIIDTDFKGWRTFDLIESDNGDRNDHKFENGIGLYDIYRSSLNNNRITGVRVETEGDMTGVRMSSIIAYEHNYNVLKNPTVKINDNNWVMFECELMSSDFIEWDGKRATVTDRYGNEKEIWFKAENFKTPRGSFKAELSARSLNRWTGRARLTFGFTGKEIK